MCVRPQDTTSTLVRTLTSEQQELREALSNAAAQRAAALHAAEEAHAAELANARASHEAALAAEARRTAAASEARRAAERARDDARDEAQRVSTKLRREMARVAELERANAGRTRVLQLLKVRAAGWLGSIHEGTIKRAVISRWMRWTRQRAEARLALRSVLGRRYANPLAPAMDKWRTTTVQLRDELEKE